MGNILIHLLSNSRRKYKKANRKIFEEKLNIAVVVAFKKAEKSYPPHQKTQQEKLFRYAK